MGKLIGKTKLALRKLFFREKKFERGIKFWKYRVKLYGRRSVLHVGHTDEEYEAVTEKQKKEIYPYFRSSLNGNEKIVLDFGCGPGRFTADLAAMINGKAIGIEPVLSLIKMASKSSDVEYMVMKEGSIPLPDEYADIVWICLVMGGIGKKALGKTVEEIKRVLKKNGLLFLIENTSEKESSKHWLCMSLREFQEIFHFVKLNHLHDYYDLGERISVMSGRKIV